MQQSGKKQKARKTGLLGVFFRTITDGLKKGMVPEEDHGKDAKSLFIK
ncbi:hypothetical protein IHQ71_02890 [Rhizobium sp. TH2]|nr:hypothetical protein [Rhizobium sp. TH2]UVC09590.1 hypothetical protein IHQ71_02890 [Rhizobium sp. TH2]